MSAALLSELWFVVRRMLRRLPLVAYSPHRVLALVICGVVLSGAYLLVHAYTASFQTFDEWQRQRVVVRTGEAVEALFTDTFRRGLLRFNPQLGTLELGIDCRAQLESFVPQADAATEAAARELCRSEAGRTLRGEIDAWNNETRVLAVRDTHLAGEPCVRPELVATTYVPIGCHPAKWQSSVRSADRDRALDAYLAQAPRVEVYGFLATPPQKGFGEWRRVDPGILSASTVVLEADLASHARRDPILVDLIGDLDGVEVDGTALYARGRSTGGLQVTLLCAAGSGAECTSGASSAVAGGEPTAYRLSIPRSTRATTKVVIVARARVTRPPSIAKLRDARWDDRSPEDESEFIATERAVALTDFIVAECHTISADEGTEVTGQISQRSGTIATAGPASAPKRNCTLKWKPREDPEPRIARGTLEVTLPPRQQQSTTLTSTTVQRDGRQQIDATAQARALGLLPVVGLDQNDLYSLVGQAALRVPAGTGRRIELTLDPRLQAHSHGMLSEILSRRDKGDPPISADLPREWDDKRRGALVLIDAGPANAPPDAPLDPETGRVLAVATWPQLEPGLSYWDVLASDRYRPSESPLATRAWSRSDRFFAPGSALKPLIALAAVDESARGNSVIPRYLGVGSLGEGGMTRRALAQTLGSRFNFSFDSTSLIVPLGNDNSSRSLSIRNHQPSATLCTSVLGACDQNSRLNLTGAVARSSNMWFARLALALDEDKVTTPSGNSRVELYRRAGPTAQPLVLARVAERLWPKEGIDLAATIREPGEAPPQLTFRLLTDRIILDASNPNQPRRASLALNGIGQAAQATPLAMASIMASIATGRIVVPRLIEADGAAGAREARTSRHGEPLFDTGAVDGRAFNQELARELMRELRAALKAVIVQPAGTAYNTFAAAGNLRNRVYGKTGTAQIGGSDDVPNTVWFVGWIEGLGVEPYGGRRVAFACALTHVDKERGTGGRVCAPAIRDLLQRIADRRT